MSNIIFENVIDKISTSTNNINSYFSNIDYYNTNIYDIYTKIPKSNIIIYILIIFLLFNFISRLEIRLNEIMTFLVCTLLIYILFKKDYSEFIKYTNQKKDQLKFLNDLIFNDTDIDYAKLADIFIKPVGKNKKSFLYLNPLIVEFFFNLRNYSQENIAAYVNSIIHCNNVIGLSYQSEIGLDRSYLNFELAIEETKKALNDFNSLIYTISLSKKSYNKLKESTDILHSLLNKHISTMSVIFKHANKNKELNNGERPDSFYDMYFKISEDDTKTSDYISVYNVY
jgi:hypothetical protein